MNSFIRLPGADTAFNVNFPGLDMSFSLNKEALFVGPFTIYWYGIIFVLGIVLGTCYALNRAKKNGINPDKLTDIIMFSILAAVVGARAYYVAFSWDYYSVNTGEIIKVWNGGIAFYGGVIGAVVCAFLLCRLWKMPLLRILDVSLGGLLLGQSIGRWGNFINVEAFGGYYDGVLRMTSPLVDSYFRMYPDRLTGLQGDIDMFQILGAGEIPVHPTFLYESLWTMAGFLFIMWYARRQKFNGEITLMYFAINGAGRAFIEGFRTDSLMLGNIRVSQLLAVVLVLLSATLWATGINMMKKNKMPQWMQLSNEPVGYPPKKAEDEESAKPVEDESNEEVAEQEQETEAVETENPSNENK